MKSYLHIKGRNLWKLCALIVMGIVITCCATNAVLTQQSAATVNQTIPITLNITYCSPYGSNQAQLVVAVLLPNGWAGAKNMTMTYSSPLGNGNMILMPSTVKEPHSGISWPAALTNTFNIANNYINDMQWVVFESDKSYTVSSASAVTVDMKLTVGADGNNCALNPAYLVAETNDGLPNPPTDTYLSSSCNNIIYSNEYYELVNGPRLTVTGGTPGTFIDYADPQLGVVNPAKAMIDDYLTVTFFGNIKPTALLNASQVYLHATAYNDNVAYPVIGQNAKTMMAQTSASSNVYTLSLWPRAYFGLGAAAKVDSMKYTFTDANGSNEVFFTDSTKTPFKFVFGCSGK